MKLTHFLLFLGGLGFLLFCCTACDNKTNNLPVTASIETTSSFETEKIALATSVGTQAYLFGHAIVTQFYFRNRMKKMLQASKVGKNVLKYSPSADDGLHFNEIIHVRNLMTHEMKTGASPNTDTRYSIVFFNLNKGSQILYVPPIEDRYFSIQITDAYLANQPYICSRLEDTKGGYYQFMSKNSEEAPQKGMIPITLHHDEFLVLIRILVKDRETDHEAVTTIQDAFKLQSLEDYQGKTETNGLTPVPSMPPVEGLDYFEKMVDLMQKHPPVGQEQFIWNMLGQVGMRSNQAFEVEKLDSPTQKGLVQGMKNGKSILNWRAKERAMETGTGWFYNTALGAATDNYMLRSEWAMQGLTVNSAEEALYFNVFKDGKGETLRGENQYTLHLGKDYLPPVDAFWSITSYDENFDFVPNEDFHYSVGDRNDDLKYNDDGSLTIYVQNTKPASGKGNWIPTPKEGTFKLNFRFYNPKPIVFDSEQIHHFLPAVEKIELKD